MRTDRILRIGVVAIVLAGVIAVLGAPRAFASCHAFTIKVSPASVTEGAAVKVTVTRDGAVNPSSIHVSSVDETAKAGSDYTAVDKTISMTNETEQSFNVATTNDQAVEQAETFRLHMSDPSGCGGGPYSVGSDAKVTITNNDIIAPAPTTTAKPIANPTTTKPGQATTTSAVATTSKPATTTTQETTTSLAAELASDDDDSPAAAIALGVGAIAVLGAIGYLVYRRRQEPPTS